MSKSRIVLLCGCSLSKTQTRFFVFFLTFLNVTDLKGVQVVQ